MGIKSGIYMEIIITVYIITLLYLFPLIHNFLYNITSKERLKIRKYLKLNMYSVIYLN